MTKDAMTELITPRISTDLSPATRDQFVSLVRDNIDLFVDNRQTLQKARLPPLELKLKTGVKPKKAKPYRMSAPDLEATLKTARELLEGRQIVHSNSEWASPTILVSKADGSRRMCVDYQYLNSCLEGDAYPLPNIEENISQLSGSKLFAVFDMAFGYEQLEVEPNSRYLTSFVVPGAQYEY